MAMRRNKPAGAWEPYRRLRDREYEALHVFFERVGGHVYGRDWSKAKAVSQCRQFVIDEISEALALPIAEATTVLMVRPLEPPDISDPYETVRFEIEPQSWTAASVVQALSDEGVVVPDSSLSFLEGKMHAHLADRFENASVEKHNIYIREPPFVISQNYNPGTIPDDAWFKRYRQYKKAMSYEMPAVAWRYIAVEGKSRQNLTVEELVGVMESYLIEQGILIRQRLATATLHQIATRVCDQFERKDINSRALVATNPDVPLPRTNKRPKKQPPR